MLSKGSLKELDRLTHERTQLEMKSERWNCRGCGGTLEETEDREGSPQVENKPSTTKVADCSFYETLTPDSEAVVSTNSGGSFLFKHCVYIIETEECLAIDHIYLRS